jgi:hypothetical protein
LGIRPSFLADSGYEATEFVSHINRALASRGLPAYKDPTGSFYPNDTGKFGRSALDHDGAAALLSLGGYGEAIGRFSHLSLLAINPYRVAFLPIAFCEPIQTGYSERLDGEAKNIWIGSLSQLQLDLAAAAEELGIPLSAGNISDVAADHINNFERMVDGDNKFEELADERAAWLLVYEGCRLAILSHTALAFAG